MRNGKNKIISPFEALSSKDVASAGGKGASLGEMTQAGIPVPQGYVILSHAFENFLEETGLHAKIDAMLGRIDHKDIRATERSCRTIRALIRAADMPEVMAEEIRRSFKKLGAEHVAVRSSATAEDSASAAWAGQLESYLNTTEEHLLENVKKCWASLFTPRAVSYRFEKNLRQQKISVAVVVQKMVESELSGIAFSVHPVTHDKNQIIIEAGFGLGEAIVSGHITPDNYVIEKTPRRIIDKHIITQTKGLYRSASLGNEWKDIPKITGEKQALTDEQILELSQIIIRIENHYGFPCDIEWAARGGKFYIVQSRPITTLGQSAKNYVATAFGNWELGATRNVSFWHQWISSLGHFNRTTDFGINSRLQQAAITIDGTQTSLFVRPENILEYSAAVLQLVGTMHDIEKLKARYRTFSDELFFSLDVLQRETHTANWDDFMEKFTRFCAGFYLTATIGRAGMAALTGLLKKQGIAAVDIPEIIALVTYPDEHTPLFKSRLDLLGIGAKVQNGIRHEEKDALLAEWLKDHGCIPVNFCEDPWTPDDALKQLDELLHKDCESELRRFNREHKNKVEQKNQKLAKIGNEKYRFWLGR